MTKVDETKSWHQKIGHHNLKSMKKIVSEEVVKGFRKLMIEEGKVCGECQIGKKTKMSHKKSRIFPPQMFLNFCIWT